MRSPLLSLLPAALLTALVLTSAAANAPKAKPGMPTLKRQESGLLTAPHVHRPSPEALTLLDEVGRLSRPVSPAEFAAWQRELRGAEGKGRPVRSHGKADRPSTRRKTSVERRGQLHLWVGEYKLTHNEDPAGAYWHFRTIQRLSGKGETLARLKGRAVFNIAIGRFFQGAYEEATHRFEALVAEKTGLPGYDRRQAALWYRHAAACYGYHQRRAAAGITEPEETDPYCGAASLAVVLRSMGRPHDRASVTRVCRVTGFGSTLQDLLTAADRLKLAAYPVTLDEAGMKAIPKPVIVHVEHDHFVVLLRADERGVTYGCSDCGHWPGGTRDVTWDQWRLMEPGVFAAIYRRDSLPDRAVRAALAEAGAEEARSPRPNVSKGGKPAGVRLAALPEARAVLLGQLSTLTSALKGHIFQVNNLTARCGTKPESQHCPPYACCPMDAGGAAALAVNNTAIAIACAPSSGDPVNLATLEEEYQPGPDLVVYNPAGPSVSWSRLYNSLRPFDYHYAFDDFGIGWSHPYNVVFYDDSGKRNPQLVAGATGTSPQGFGADGSDAPAAGLTWSVVRGGTTVATSSAPNGWSVGLAGGATPSFMFFQIPASATTALDYQIRHVGTGSGPVSGYFDLMKVNEVTPDLSRFLPIGGAEAPAAGLTWDILYNGTTIATSARPAGWSAGAGYNGTTVLQVNAPLTTVGSGYKVRVANTGSATFSVLAHRYRPRAGGKWVVWPNGSRTQFTAAAVPTAGTPTVVCAPATSGVPYALEWRYSAADPMGYFTLVTADRNRLTSTLPTRILYGRVLGMLSQLTNATGQSLNFTYGPGAGFFQPSPIGATVNFSGLPLLASIQDGSGQNLLTFSRATDGSGALAGVHDRYNRSVYYASSAHQTNQGRPLIQLDQVSLVVATGTVNPPLRYQYGYTLSGVDHASETFPFLHTITTPSPTGSGTATATIEYTPAGFVSALVDANGNRREYVIVAANQTKVQTKNALGAVVHSYTVSFNADMTEATRTDGTNTTVVETRAYSDPDCPHEPSSVKDGLNREALFTYDQYGNVLTQTSPKGTVTTYTYDYHVWPFGRLLSVQEGSKTPTTFTYYEPSGLIQSVTGPRPGTTGGTTVTTSFTYDSLGNVLTVTGPGNGMVSTKTATLNYTTDGTYSQPAKVGQPLTITDNLGNATHFRYDARGNRTSAADALLIETTVAYNLVDQPTQVTLPATGQNGPSNSYTLNTYQYVGGPLANTKLYNESGTLIRQVDYAYGPEGETLAGTGSTEPVSYTYDAAYRLKTLADGKNQATTYSYNTRGYLSQVTYPGLDTVSYPSYANDGQLLQRVDGRGITTNYVYNDPDGLLTNIQYPAYPALNVGMSYDTYGRLTSMTDGSGSHGYSYDYNDALTSETTTYTGVPGKTVSYAFHPDGSLQSMTSPAGTFQYGYDGTGRMTSVTNPYGQTTTWTYLNNDWLKTQKLHNNATTTYTYDALARVTDLVTRSGPNAADPLRSSFTGMVHDGAGNRLSLTASLPAHPAYSGTTNYTYDTKNQLTQETSTRAGGYTNNFVYDPAGNPTTFKGASRSYNSNNQDATNVHDGSGNPTTYKGVTCTYDPENRMTAYGTVLTAGYRGDGLRAWKQTSVGRTYFLYDGGVLLAEMNAVGAVTAVNTWGATGLISRTTSSGSVFYTFDPHGSVAQRLDSAGMLLSSHVWDGYGTGSSSGGSDIYGYAAQAGYYTDTASGLQLLTHRYYDPSTGRFLNRDPIGTAGGINLYAYCSNDPITAVDPSGTIPSKGFGRTVLGAAILGTAWLVKRDIDVWKETQDLYQQSRSTDAQTARMQAQLERMRAGGGRGGRPPGGRPPAPPGAGGDDSWRDCSDDAFDAWSSSGGAGQIWRLRGPLRGPNGERWSYHDVFRKGDMITDKMRYGDTPVHYDKWVRDWGSQYTPGRFQPWGPREFRNYGPDLYGRIVGSGGY